MDDGVRREVFNVGSWHPVDFVLGPMFVAGYLYWRGWERGWNWGDLEGKIRIEPLRRILYELADTDNILVSAASLEFGVEACPVKVIVSGGILHGALGMDFIGIGTSVGKARQAVQSELRAGSSVR